MAPSTAKLLDIWDAGSTLDHTGRALLLLQLAHADHGKDRLMELTIGERDEMLLDVREHLFGSLIDAVDSCGACGAQVQVAFEIGRVREHSATTRSHSLTVLEDDYEVEARLPTSADLLAIRRCETIEDGRALLLARCVSRARYQDGDFDPRDLPESVQREIARAMGEADPLANIELVLACAACCHEWRRQFDVVDYLWTEIERFGSKTLRDVHLLARHYGWSEETIVGLSPFRRRWYLEMVSNG